jgi:heptosyltransferase I
VKILVVKPSSLGDIIHALPTVRILRHAFSQADIAWLVNDGFAPLLEGCPVINRIIPFARRRYATLDGCVELGHFVKSLRRERFDWVIDLQGLLRSSLITLFSGARRRTGLSDAREGATSFYNDLVKIPPLHLHAVDRYLMLPRQLGLEVDRVEFPLAPDPRGPKAARESLILINPGARWLTKRWPAPRFSELVACLAARWPDHRIAIIGSADERLGCEAIAKAAHAPVEVLAGRTTLPQLMDLMRRARLLVSNDSGPMHLAVAVGTPVVGIFGPTNPRLTGPYPASVHAVLYAAKPCSPCLKGVCKPPVKEMECMTAIGVTEVVNATDRLMRKL